MKKIRLSIPMLRKEYFEFYIFDLSFKNNSKGELLLKYFYFLGNAIFLLSFFLFPFSNFLFQDLTPESALLKFLLLVMPINLAFYLGTVILNGKRRFVDPPFFLAVLIFALGTTTSSVLTANPSLGNTFGVNNIRGAAGISIIIFITLYYLSVVYIHNRELLRRAIKYLVAGIFAYITLKVINLQSISSLEDITLMMIGAGAFFALSKSIVSYRRFKLWAAIGASLIVIAGLLNKPLVFSDLNLLLIPLFLSLSIVLLSIYLSKKTFLKVIWKDSKRDFKALSSGKFEFWEISRILSVWLIILSPLIVLLIFILLDAQNPSTFLAFKNTIESTFKVFNSSVDFSKGLNSTTLSTFLFGNGAASLISSNSFVANIILSQGFIGLCSYLFLWTYGIMTAARFVYYNFKKGGNYNVPSLLLFIISIVAFESFFFYPGLKLIYIWWVAFAFVTIKYKFRNKENYLKFSDKDFEISKSHLGGLNVHRYVKYLISILLILAAIYISNSFILVLARG